MTDPLTQRQSPADTRERLLVRLDAPQKVGGEPVRYQSLWLLMRVYFAARYESAPVSLASLKIRFGQSGAAGDLRMLISRAFADFARWGVAVGWGDDRQADVRLLPTRGRSKGPFWLAAHDVSRIAVMVGDTPPDDPRRDIAAFLGLPQDTAQGKPSPALDYVMQDIAFWHHLTLGKRDMQDGVFFAPEAPSPGEARRQRTGAIPSFHAAQVCAVDDVQRGIALLAETLVWRRMGDGARTQRSLATLAATFHANQPGSPTLRAMHWIVQAWQAYALRDEAGAFAHLQRIGDDPSLAPCLVYNPRIRFETRNLQALLHKSRAARPGPMPIRAQSAADALAAFSDALQAAFEADSIELAQHVAANIGLSLWLFWQEALIDPGRRLAVTEVQRQSLRWIGLSEWICDRFGVGGNSVWNTVFLLRIARGGVPARRDPDLATLRASTPLTVDAFLDAVQPFGAPFSRAKGFRQWTDVVATTLADHEDGRVRFEPLQLANLWFEMLWFALHQDGDSPQALHAARSLGRVLPILPPPDRRFFRDALRLMPREFQREVRLAR
ncbi:hypothetical protein [Pandoraea pulmonicola]|uniref:Uncharacterized protein n=1 Tax=Pandoraea pulmonicola TaxID=93221 RepID=A0AAJ5D1Z4_PANPU|nr:hypothetical protein [Pandoraea pulmonicola]APD13619.1 hypothetical protein RO07_02775 [Pandoraea pulmonicola]SUA92209.1 Uncharacterised protein [Pandoraea pulmonicola]